MTLTIKINKSGPYKSGVSKRVHKGQIPNIVYGLTQSDPTRHVTYAVASQQSSVRIPTQAESLNLYSVDDKEAADWADNWANTIGPLREGYSRYLLREPIQPIKGGVRIEPAEALDIGLRLMVAAIGHGFDQPKHPEERTLSAGNWFRGTSALLAAIIRGMLVSQKFFDLGAWPLDPLSDTFTLHEDLERPETQLELVRSMTEQLLSELTATGEDRLNREDLWTSIKEQEILMLRDALRKDAERDIGEWEREMVASLKGKAIDRALAGLIEDLEAEGSSCAEGAELAQQVLDKVMTKKGKKGVKPVPPKQLAKWQNEYVAEAREALKAQAYAEAETEWKHWRENQLVKAQAEAIRRLSIKYVIEQCGDDAAAVIAEKRQFAKEFAHANYQNWLDQVMADKWPEIEDAAQGWTRQQYLDHELAKIYPDVHEEAHRIARKEAQEAATAHGARLEQQLKDAADKRFSGELAVLQTRATKTEKAVGISKSAAKRARKAAIGAGRTDFDQMLTQADESESPSPEDTWTVMPSPQPGETNVERIEAVAAAIGPKMELNPFQAFAHATAVIQPDFYRESSLADDATAAAAPETERPIMVKELDINEEVAESRTLATSTHAPQTPPTAVEAIEPQVTDSTILALQALLAPMQQSINALAEQVRVIDRRTRPDAAEAHTRAPSPPPFPPQELVDDDFPMLASPSSGPSGTEPPPAPQQDKEASSLTTAPTQKAGRPEVGSDTVTPPAAPSPPPQSSDEGESARTATVAQPTHKGKGKAKENDGFIPVTRPRAGYNVVTAKAVTQQQAAKKTAKLTAAAQSRTPAGRLLPNASPTPRNVTRVVVSRDGGFKDQTRELQLRAIPASIIAQGVRTAIERNTPAPIKILSAQWAKGVEKTGNYVYNIVGEIPMERILQFSKFLLQPFPGGVLVPASGWCWAQLRDVLVSDADGVIYDNDTLTEELRLNPMFADATFVTDPHWKNGVNLPNATSDVVFAYLDPTKSITQRAIKEGVSMFTFGVKFVFCGDNPRPKQCGRCFEMGHVTNATECRWTGKNRCVRCGQGHHHDDHDMSCKATTHKSADRCDCKFKCLLCGQIGHNARSRSCKTRGDFPPPKAVPNLRDTGSTAAPPAPTKSILKRPTELPTPTPPSFTPARVDDEEPSLFDPATLSAEATEGPVAGPSNSNTSTSAPPSTPTPAPKARKPRARIVLPHTDTAKPGETSTERAATRNQPASPSEVQGPLAPAIPKTRGDTKVARMGAAQASLEINPKLVRSSSPSSDGVMREMTAAEKVKKDFPPLPHHAKPINTEERMQLAQIEDRAFQIATEALSGIAMVRVRGEWYDCPSNELNWAFRKLRERELATLMKMRNGVPIEEEDRMNWLAKYEREALKSRAFGAFDLHGNPTTEKLQPSAVLSKTKPVFPL
ncbi:hypothetical protein EDB83DRAFT_2579864 [Lactarius deliciosus]|nr:hypothetical protein EDB83DRAFT_2579864 [Lactarius deliciosus]